MAILGYDVVLEQVVERIRKQSDVVGVMLQGSVARGDHYHGSDLDLLVIVADGHGNGFEADHVGSIFVERHFMEAASLTQKLVRRPDLAYGVVDGRILHDPEGVIADAVEYARSILADHVTPAQELEDIRYWLYTVRIKIVAASGAGDELKMAFLVSTNAWKILEGIWAVNNLPMPPSGAVFAHLRKLPVVPEGFADKVSILFLGTPAQRIASSLALIDWFLRQAIFAASPI